MRPTLVLAAALCLFPLVPARAQEAAAPPPAVATRLDMWHDAKRDRDVDVKLYIPAATPPAKDAKEPAAPKLPVVIFSHGLGGSRDGYRYLGEHLASRGYLVILPTHEGSDAKAVESGVRDRFRTRGRAKAGDPPAKGYLEESTSDPENLKGRPADISFVIDHLVAEPALHADLDRIAVAGHSFGAYTTLAIAGMTVNLAGEPAHPLRDPRVKLGIAMSPQGSGAMRVETGAWDPITIPVLLLTGTKDYGQGERIAAWRRQPFDEIKKAGKNPDAWLMVITDATHMTFATSGSRPLRKNTDEEAGPHQQLILKTVDAFLDAHLLAKPNAMDWLKHAAAEHRADCTVETTAPVPAPAPKEPAAAPASR